ncbi:MAG: hypothetical protein AW09_003661 [Candidatus Accumulibacter phosphatis]|uniref:Uncharacterized protein n=1 Tax=Candidatus Accumulibacter phosphatis TaxID=327160 RepID=A0A080LS94_9PROT|nr:MAG: hypothetical protein AW09_003661 [Candidatus Accumulibacter phosphatis]
MFRMLICHEENATGFAVNQLVQSLDICGGASYAAFGAKR